MTHAHVESKHGRKWFWSGRKITFVTLGGRWRRFTFLARKFRPERLPQ